MDNSYPARFGRLSFEFKSAYRALQAVVDADTLTQAKDAAQWVLDYHKAEYEKLIAEDAETEAWLKARTEAVATNTPRVAVIVREVGR